MPDCGSASKPSSEHHPGDGFPTNKVQLLSLPHLNLLLALRDRVVLIAHAVARHAPELRLGQLRSVDIATAHLQLLERNDVLVLTKAQETAPTDYGVLLAGPVDQHPVDGAQLLALCAVDVLLGELGNSDGLALAHLRLSLPLLPLLHLGLLLCLLILLPALLLTLRLGLLLLLASKLLLPCLLLPHLLLALLVGRHLLEADLRLAFSLLVLNPRLTHALDVHLRLAGSLDRGLDLTLRRLHLHLGLCPLHLDLRLLLRLPDGHLRLRHLHLNLWLWHLHSDLRLRHADRDLRLRLLNRDGRWWDLNRDLWLRLADGHLRLGLLDGDARSRRSDLHLRWTLLNRYL